MYLVGTEAKLEYAEPALGIELYFYTARNGKPAAVAFRGKSQKPSIRCYYSTEESRAKCASEWIKAVAQEQEQKKKRRAEKAAFQHTLSVGQIMVASWGWEQTNIDYYEVVAVKGKSVMIRPIAQEREYTQWLAGNCKPAPGHYTGEPMLKRVQEGNRIKFESYKSAYPIENGRGEHYFSQYA